MNNDLSRRAIRFIFKGGHNTPLYSNYSAYNNPFTRDIPCSIQKSPLHCCSLLNFHTLLHPNPPNIWIKMIQNAI